MAVAWHSPVQWTVALLMLGILLPSLGRAHGRTAMVDTLPALTVIQLREPPAEDSIRMMPNLSLPAEAAGYTLILPQGEVKGLAVLFHSGRDTSHLGYEMRLYVEAVRRQVAIVYLTTGNPFEFLFDTSAYQKLDRYLGLAIQHPRIGRVPMLFAGMSLAGTRALKFAVWCAGGNSAFGLRPRALALCDAPLDFVRFWREQQRALLHQTHPISASEATWVNYQLEQHLGGTPLEVPDHYYAYSPYVYGLDPDIRLRKLAGIAVRTYTEPDVQWWLEERNKNYYGFNSIDAAALINDLRLLGNTEAALITTTGQGKRPDGSRHPHSWSIVDNGELIDWFLGLPFY